MALGVDADAAVRAGSGCRAPDGGADRRSRRAEKRRCRRATAPPLWACCRAAPKVSRARRRRARLGRSLRRPRLAPSAKASPPRAPALQATALSLPKASSSPQAVVAHRDRAMHDVDHARTGGERDLGVVCQHVLVEPQHRGHHGGHEYLLTMGTLCVPRRVTVHFALPQRDLHPLTRLAKSRSARP